MLFAYRFNRNIFWYWTVTLHVILESGKVADNSEQINIRNNSKLKTHLAFRAARHPVLPFMPLYLLTADVIQHQLSNINISHAAKAQVRATIIC